LNRQFEFSSKFDETILMKSGKELKNVAKLWWKL